MEIKVKFLIKKIITSDNCYYYNSNTGEFEHINFATKYDEYKEVEDRIKSDKIGEGMYQIDKIFVK